MSAIKQFITILLFIALLIAMVKNAKKTVQKVANVEDVHNELTQSVTEMNQQIADAIEQSTEGIEVEVEQTSGTVIGHTINDDKVTMSTDGTVTGSPAEAPATGSGDIPTPSFAKPKIQKKVKALSEEFIQQCQSASEEGRKEIFMNLIQEVKDKTNQIEYLKQTYNLQEPKAEKKTADEVTTIKMKVNYKNDKNEVKTVEMMFMSDRTIAHARDEIANAFRISKTHYCKWTLSFNNIDLCASSRGTIGTVLKKNSIPEGSVFQFVKYEG